MSVYIFTFHLVVDPVTYISRIHFGGGGFKIFARGVRGHAPPRHFLKMVQFGAF